MHPQYVKDQLGMLNQPLFNLFFYVLNFYFVHLVRLIYCRAVFSMPPSTADNNAGIFLNNKQDN